ncbi:hypothetical protein [Ferrimicrobium sp.]|uniref:beta strand repeat-containing protein n=1 Tax=Ferrimicrobium sp. TaxID=2926050 RepID=UPI002637586A|nr:hypothetical protein [Ferrimicrobium sp.]
MSRFKKKTAGISGSSKLSSNGLVRLAGAAALTVGGVGGILIASGTAYATTPNVTSGYYTVGTGSVTGFTVTPGSNYVASFVATDGVGSSSTPGTVSITLPGTTITNGSAFASGVSALVTVNGTQVGFAAYKSTSAADQVTLTLPTVVTSGASVQIEFIGVSNPSETSAVTETGSMYTSTDTLVVQTNYTIPANSVSFGATASNVGLGQSDVTYNVGPIAVSSGATGLGTSAAPFVLTFTPSATGDASVDLPGASSQYTVTVTNSSGAKSTDTVTGVTASDPSTGASSASLVLTTPLVSGDTVNVTITGAINPSQAGSSPVTVSDSGNSNDSATISYGTQIGSLSTSLMPSTSSANPTTGATANFVASFVATDGVTAGSSGVIITPGSGLALPTSGTAAVTVGSGSSATTVAESYATASGVTSVAMPTVNSGQDVSITIFGATVTGVSGQNSYSVSVATNKDSLAATASASEDFTTIPGSVPVSLSNAGLQATSNYTVSGLEATANMTGQTSAGSTTLGNSGGESQLELIFPSNTILPTSASDYSITDTTTSSASGQPIGVDVSGPDVYVTLANTVSSGDVFSVSVDGAINPSTASNQYSIGINGSVEAAPVSVTSVPKAATTYPNGALIQSGGQIDVIAGGYAFGISTPTVLSDIMKMDHSSVVSGTFPTATMPAPGTLINPVGTSGYWVVGTNGEIYQFSSMSQFMKDGYVVSQVIPVPNAGGLTAGAGAPPTAAATMANGALVQFGSTIYEYAGGVATGIATPAELASIQKMTGAMVVMGFGSTPTNASTSANGTLVQPLGKAGVWVSNDGTLYQFMTASQFMTDGYSFQYVLPVAMTGSYTLSSI